MRGNEGKYEIGRAGNGGYGWETGFGFGVNRHCGDGEGAGERRQGIQGTKRDSTPPHGERAWILTVGVWNQLMPLGLVAGGVGELVGWRRVVELGRRFWRVGG
jgi:hypothetical protein